MYLFVIHAKPRPGAQLDPEAQGAAGAYASCWIDFKQKDGAQVLASHYVEEAGFNPVSVDESHYVEEDGYKGTPEHKYFVEAMETGLSLVFHLYPDEEEKENGDDA